jgi:3-hydroxybutyrate dehydrogenase
VTGAASGIGERWRAASASGGARVALLDIDEDGRERAIAGLADAAKSALPLCCDVADEPEVKRAVASASESFHGLVTFVANAAIEHPGDSRRQA